MPGLQTGMSRCRMLKAPPFLCITQYSYQFKQHSSGYLLYELVYGLDWLRSMGQGARRSIQSGMQLKSRCRVLGMSLRMNYDYRFLYDTFFGLTMRCYPRLLIDPMASLERWRV